MIGWTGTGKLFRFGRNPRGECEGRIYYPKNEIRAVELRCLFPNTVRVSRRHVVDLDFLLLSILGCEIYIYIIMSLLAAVRSGATHMLQKIRLMFMKFILQGFIFLYFLRRLMPSRKMSSPKEQS